MGMAGRETVAGAQERSRNTEDILLEVRRLAKYFPVISGVLFKRTVGIIKAVGSLIVVWLLVRETI